MCTGRPQLRHLGSIAAGGHFAHAEDHDQQAYPHDGYQDQDHFRLGI
jgi:hypothetical protein